ncbi:MAG: DUF1844 domain-containing protein [Terriglobales bacterium]
MSDRESPEPSPEPSIVISDRRHFTATGERRPGVAEEDRDVAPMVDLAAAKAAAPPAADPAASASGKKASAAIPFPAPAAAPEPPPAPEPAGDDALGPEEATPFLALLESLYASAMIQLGASAPGEISRPEPDFPAARQTIEILGVLQNKTHGNLTPGEARTLEEMLYELRLYYVQMTRARGQK